MEFSSASYSSMFNTVGIKETFNSFPHFERKNQKMLNLL